MQICAEYSEQIKISYLLYFKIMNMNAIVGHLKLWYEYVPSDVLFFFIRVAWKCGQWLLAHSPDGT